MDNCITSLGLMSGTSLDGIDASIINSDGNSHLKVKVNHFYEYKAEFRQKLRDYIKNINSIEDIDKQYNLNIKILRKKSLFFIQIYQKN